jgi:hypothetical protein
MSKLVITQSGSKFQVRVDDPQGRVIGEFPTKSQADAYVKNKRQIAASEAGLRESDSGPV